MLERLGGETNREDSRCFSEEDKSWKKRVADKREQHIQGKNQESVGIAGRRVEKNRH